jgi:peptide deformylase
MSDEMASAIRIVRPVAGLLVVIRWRALYREDERLHIRDMALLKIARMGHPVLRIRAKPVEDPAAPWVRRLVEDMIETMEDAGGTGIAAPQVHMPWRIVVFRVGGERLTDLPGDSEQPLTALINPVVEPVGDEIAFGWEGCLSVPGLRGVVPRHLRIRYAATGLDGRTIERQAAGFHARVVQHECDHLDGILYPQRITDHRLLGFVEELQRHPLDVAALLGTEAEA